MPTFNFARLRGKLRIDPARDWIVLLTLSLIALAGIVVWNIWAFETIAAGGTLGGAATTTPAAFNREALDSIQNLFRTRAEDEAKYRTGVYRYDDPSQ